MTEKSTGECEEKLSNMKLENGQSEIETEKNNTPPTSATIPSKTFQENFKLFAKFGDPKSEGKHITLSNSDKWMKQAKIIDGKKITTTDTAIHFKKLKIQKVGINDYKKFLEDLANSKKIGMEEILNKLLECGPPGHHGVGTVKATSTVERLTDTSKYTGSHKQKFEEVGKGKGVAGKKDNPETPRTVNTKKN